MSSSATKPQHNANTSGGGKRSRGAKDATPAKRKSSAGGGTAAHNNNAAADDTSAADRPQKKMYYRAAEEVVDEAFSSMYTPLPASMQLGVDHTASNTAASSSSSAYIPSLISSLVPPSQFQSNFASKLEGKNLMLDNTKTSAGGDAQTQAAKRRRKKQGVKMMSANQRKEKGLTQISKKDVKYIHFLPLHALWISYMHDILDPTSSRGLSTGERVLKADYHGAIFTVIKSRSPTHIGLRGIMIQETQETFQIVTEKNAVKVVPKRQSVFAITVPQRVAGGGENDATASSSSSSSSTHATVSSSSSSSIVIDPAHVFELYGDHLCFRSYERSSRKFKTKATIQL